LEYFFICSDNPKKWTLNEMRQTGPNYSTVWCAEWDFEAGAVVTELRNAYSYRKQLDSNSIVSKLFPTGETLPVVLFTGDDLANLVGFMDD
jgi:hypothetical protein